MAGQETSFVAWAKRQKTPPGPDHKVLCSVLVSAHFLWWLCNCGYTERRRILVQRCATSRATAYLLGGFQNSTPKTRAALKPAAQTREFCNRPGTHLKPVIPSPGPQIPNSFSPKFEYSKKYALGCVRFGWYIIGAVWVLVFQQGYLRAFLDFLKQGRQVRGNWFNGPFNSSGVPLLGQGLSYRSNPV